MLKITSFSFAVVCLMLGSVSQPVSAATATVATTSTSTSSSTISSTATSSVTKHDAQAVEKKVRESFADVPVMIEIARCESKFRQFNDSGTVLRGGGSGGMIGIFQFYEVIHKKPALALGFDIETVEGNIGYARHMYSQEGTRPWASCVPDVIPVVIPVAKVLSQADKELQIKLLTKVVELLQELLKMDLAKR